MRTIQLPEGFAGPERRISARANRRDWYKIEDKADEVAEVYIYDEIGLGALTAKDFVGDLGKVTASQINLHLNTPGGDAFDGIAIHNALVAHKAAVHVTVDSLAASIGSVIAMAGETITMAKHATMMIHDPYGLAMGNAADMAKMAEVLNQLGDTIAGVYMDHAGGTVSEWRARMLEETWYNDRQAVEAGLADEVAGDAAQAAAGFDLSIFKHAPADLLRDAAGEVERGPSKRDLERALRDAGLTRAEAKALLAKGYQSSESDDGARDVSELAALLAGLKQLI